MNRIRMLASAAILLGIAAGAAAQELFEQVPATTSAPSAAPLFAPVAPASNVAPAAPGLAPASAPAPTSAAAGAPASQSAPAVPASIARKPRAATAPATTSGAMKPEDAWEVLFAKEAAALNSGSSKHDYALFAAKILVAAKAVSGDPPVQAYLCNKAYEFGTAGPEGYATASAAMDLLAQQPQLKPVADAKMLSLLDLMWKAAYGERRRVVAEAFVERSESAADTLMQAGNIDKALVILRNAMSAAEVLSSNAKTTFQMHLKDANHRAALAKHVTELKTTVQMGVARAKFAAELVELYLVDMDTPGDAVSYAAMTNDAALVKTVEQAGKKPAELTEAELLGLASWYEKKLDLADEYAQYQTYPHALGLLTQYMEVHDSEDVLRLKAKLSWEQMQKKYQRAAGLVAPRKAVDLIAMVEPSKHTVNGVWKVSNGHLVGTVTERLATVLIPYQPPAEYDLRVDFRRVEGEDALVVAAMQNGKRFAWMFGAYTNTMCAMETADGAKPKNNAAIYQPAGGVFKNGTDHSVVVKVRKGGISVTMDGILIGQHATDGSDLGAVRAHWNTASPLGIILHAQQYDISRLELTEVTGTGKKWEGAAAAPPTAKPRRSGG